MATSTSAPGSTPNRLASTRSSPRSGPIILGKSDQLYCRSASAAAGRGLFESLNHSSASASLARRRPRCSRSAACPAPGSPPSNRPAAQPSVAIARADTFSVGLGVPSPLHDLAGRDGLSLVLRFLIELLGIELLGLFGRGRFFDAPRVQQNGGQRGRNLEPAEISNVLAVNLALFSTARRKNDRRLMRCMLISSR